LRAHGCASAHDVQRFFNEARAASIIEHPGVVQIFDCDIRENVAFLILEYLEGESLAAMLRRRAGLASDPEAIRVIGTQIANVLQEDVVGLEI
jgi:tRNA A-37 threonylcarbamoyl transferase component Bud32